MVNFVANFTSAAILVTTPVFFPDANVTADIPVGRHSALGTGGNTDGAGSSGQSTPAWIERDAIRLRALSANWDGLDAEPIDDRQIALITKLLTDALPDNAKRGTLVPAADGSIQAEWHLIGLSFGLVVEEGQPVMAWVRSAGGLEVEQTGFEAIELLRSAALQSLA
jgi:hypothetical protein